MAKNTAQTNIRLDANLRDELQREADANGVSLNKEIANRLMHSLRTSGSGSDVLSAPSDFRGLLVVVSEAMVAAAESALFNVTHSWELAKKIDWLDQPYAYSQARRAAEIVLTNMAPNGDVQEPGEPVRDRAEFFADHVLREAAYGLPTYEHPDTIARAHALHQGIGHLADRLTKRVGSSKRVAR